MKPATAAAIKRLIFKEWVQQNQTQHKIASLCVFDGQKNIFAPKSLHGMGIAEKGVTFQVQFEER